MSEVMLQQTQVDRVIPFYKNFLKQFPTAKKLSRAPLSDVLKVWQGLGYNRRAKMLHEAAKQMAEHTPSSIEELEALKGVGPYTARAVAAFAWNKGTLVVETNIRTVIIHHFYPKEQKVSDAQIEKVLTEVLPKGKAREWYSALMDYGAALKREGVSHNARTKTYTKQKPFKGSLREVRGAILRRLTRGSIGEEELFALFPFERKEHVSAALAALMKEGFVTRANTLYHLG